MSFMFISQELVLKQSSSSTQSRISITRLHKNKTHGCFNGINLHVIRYK